MIDGLLISDHVMGLPTESPILITATATGETTAGKRRTGCGCGIITE